ncbi:MAG: NUDIX hydrolase [Nitrospinota bacterium]
MYVEALLPEIERRYGRPREIALEFEFQPHGFARVQESLSRGRAHDVTLLIREGDRLAVIRKPSYPPHVFRAPSGGVARGEEFEAGVRREAYEETGLEVALERYLLRVRAAFTCDGRRAEWVTHVVLCRALSGEPRPVDTREVCEARWATLEEVRTSLREALLATGSGGLAYRAALQEAALEAMEGPAGGPVG